MWVWKWAIYHLQKSKYKLFRGEPRLILQWNFPFLFVKPTFCKACFFSTSIAIAILPIATVTHAAMPSFGWCTTPHKHTNTQNLASSEGEYHQSKCNQIGQLLAQHVDFTFLRNLDSNYTMFCHYFPHFLPFLELVVTF